MEKINFVAFFGQLAVYLFVWVFALTAHGALTAWVSNYFGDPTAKNEGRISLNPFVQADLTGTIIIPAIAFMISWMSPGIAFIGWGKKVPLKSENWRNPKTAGIMVTLASTFASIMIAVTAFVAIKILFVTGITDAGSFLQIVVNKNAPHAFSWLAPVQIILWYSLAINIVLAAFSLIPLPPFAGGVALFSLLPESFKPIKTFFNQFGLIIGLGLLYFVGIPYLFSPLMSSVLYLLLQ